MIPFDYLCEIVNGFYTLRRVACTSALQNLTTIIDCPERLHI